MPKGPVWPLALLALAGCVVQPTLERPRIVSLQPSKAAFAQELAPGEVALEKVGSLAQWPRLDAPLGDREALLAAIDQSLAYLAKPSSQRHYPYLDISHARVVRSLEAFRALVASGLPPGAIEAELRARFELYRSKGRAGSGEVLFTGYCEPIYDASRTPGGAFRYPLYRRPDDLASTAEGKPLGRRLADGRLVPYYTRREIDEQGALRGRGLELVYLRDPLEAFLVHIQGSARLRLVNEGGRLLPVGYAGKTDRPYRSLGKALIRDGAVAREDMSLEAIKRHFRERQGELTPYLYENESYVFFRIAEGGPFGSIGARVTAERTIATDKSVFPRAALTFVDVRAPQRTAAGTIAQAPYRRFMLDQDTGGAIRSAGRCDLFRGTGPEAEALAGHTLAVGRLYYLFVRE